MSTKRDTLRHICYRCIGGYIWEDVWDISKQMKLFSVENMSSNGKAIVSDGQIWDIFRPLYWYLKMFGHWLSAYQVNFLLVVVLNINCPGIVPHLEVQIFKGKRFSSPKRVAIVGLENWPKLMKIHFSTIKGFKTTTKKRLRPKLQQKKCVKAM